MLLAMTIGTAITVREVMLSQSGEAFSEFVDQAVAEIDADVSRSLTEIAAIEAYLRVQPGIDQESFTSVASTVGRNGPAVQSLGYIPRVLPADAGAFSTYLAETGRSDYRLGGSAPQADYFPVAYFVPPLPGFLSPGRELGDDPVYGPLLDIARREKRSVASAPGRLTGDSPGLAEFVVFSPVFAAGDSLVTGRDDLLGFAAAVYRVSDFLSGPADRSGLSDVTYRVLDRSADGDREEVFPMPDSDSRSDWPARTVLTRSILAAGRNWDIEVLSPQLFGLGPVEQQVWKIVLAAGLALTLFATASTYSLLKSRQAAHTDLQVMTSQLTVILSSALEGILLVDSAGQVVWANQSFASAFGLGPPLQLLGQDWRELFGKTGADFSNPAARTTLLERVSQDHDLTVPSEDIKVVRPEERTLSVTSAPVTGESGGYLGRLWVFRDVTAERRAVDSQAVFVSMVSHELRTPLTSMTGFVDLVLEGAAGQVNDEVKRLLRIASHNGERLTRLVSDILEVTRLETGHLSLEPGTMDLRAVVHDLLDSMRHEFVRRRQTVEVDIREGLPAVWADRQRTAQVLANLMTNAYRYTQDGGRIRITSAVAGSHLQITVSDNGQGIPSEFHGRIFEKFARVQTQGQRPQGSTGLGLAITKALVEMQGGTIIVRSQVGQGSAFTFTLPLDTANRPADAAPPGDGSRHTSAAA